MANKPVIIFTKGKGAVIKPRTPNVQVVKLPSK